MNIIFLKKNKQSKETIAFNNQGEEIILNETPLNYLNDLCIKHGSNAEGRMTSFQNITGTRQKPAILISELSREIFFPTLSKDNDDCIWIEAKSIFKTKSIDDSHTCIQFMSGYQVIVDVNRRVIEKQRKRCKDYLHIISATE